MDNAFRPPDFGQLLLERGLVSPEELAEAIRRQRQSQLAGSEPVPRLGEILVAMGVLTEAQVAQALEAQNRRILRCGVCGVQVNVELRADVREYRCGRCGGLMAVLIVPLTVRVEDSSIILVGGHARPAEVEEGSKDPSRKFGKYVLLGEIGRGGSAIVHRAWDTYLSHFVALKFIKPATVAGRAAHDSRILGLMHEARSAVRLRHPHIVQLYEVGKIDGEFYIALELLEGAPLSDLIHRAREQGKVSPFYDEPKRYLSIVRDVARALAYAHTRPNPVVHCDLKPSNVFITRAGRTCVLDFGLAHELREGNSEPSGVVRGTPAYMAPEQANGRLEQIDARTDVYGLGGILYELLAGRPPFTGEIFDVLHKAVSALPDRPSDIAGAKSVPASLEKICLKCLEKDRARRYASAKEFADDLDRVMRGEPIEKKTTRRRVKTAPPPVIVAAGPRGWRGMALAAAAAALFAVSAAFTPRDDGRERVEGLLAALKTDEAETACIAAGAREWAEAGRVEADWMAQLKQRLVDSANRSRPRLDVVRTSRGVFRDAEIVKATPRTLVLIAQDSPHEVGWDEIEPPSLVALSRRLLEMSAADRFGLGLYCMKNRMIEEARGLFDSLHPTDLAPYARRYLARLQPRQQFQRTP